MKRQSPNPMAGRGISLPPFSRPRQQERRVLAWLLRVGKTLDTLGPAYTSAGCRLLGLNKLVNSPWQQNRTGLIWAIGYRHSLFSIHELHRHWQENVGEPNNSIALGSVTPAEPVEKHGQSWVSSYLTSIFLFYSIYFMLQYWGLNLQPHMLGKSFNSELYLKLSFYVLF